MPAITASVVTVAKSTTVRVPLPTVPVIAVVAIVSLTVPVRPIAFTSLVMTVVRLFVPIAMIKIVSQAVVQEWFAVAVLMGIGGCRKYG